MKVACESSEPPVGPRLRADALQQQPGDVAGADDRGVVDDLGGAGPDAAAVEGALPGGAGEAGFLGVRAEEVRRQLLLEAEHRDEQRGLRSGEAPGQPGAGRDADVVLRADGVGAQVRRGALRNERSPGSAGSAGAADTGAAHPSAATHRNATHRFVKLATRLTIDCLRRRRVRPWAGTPRSRSGQHVPSCERSRTAGKRRRGRRFFFGGGSAAAAAGSARQVGRDRHGPRRGTARRGGRGWRRARAPASRRAAAARDRRRASGVRPRRSAAARDQRRPEQALRLCDAPVVGPQRSPCGRGAPRAAAASVPAAAPRAICTRARFTR